MSSPTTVLAVRNWIDRWNDHDLAGLAGLVADDYVHHTMAGTDLGLDGFCDGFGQVIDAFPDIRYEVRHLFSEGQLAGAYLVGTGTHSGRFIGIAPTGRVTRFCGIYHARIVDGLIREDWDVFDLLTPVFALGGEVVSGR